MTSDLTAAITAAIADAVATAVAEMELGDALQCHDWGDWLFEGFGIGAGDPRADAAVAAAEAAAAAARAAIWRRIEVADRAGWCVAVTGVPGGSGHRARVLPPGEDPGEGERGMSAAVAADIRYADGSLVYSDEVEEILDLAGAD